MQREMTADDRLALLTAAIARDGAIHDAEAAFPSSAFAELARSGLLSAPPINTGEMGKLLRTLTAIGRGDLSTGRIFEGHVNSCWLIRTFGLPQQNAAVDALLENGAIFGVWNTDAPGNPLRLENNTLIGQKNFASGVDGLSHAIVTITEPIGRRMLLVPLAGLPVDRTWWKPVGMKASGSHIVDFTGLTVEPEWFLGEPDDYISQPWFSAGAIRFVAVQLGGAHAIFDIAVQHLTKTGRADNPYQVHRLARMGQALETGYLWLDRSASAWMQTEQAIGDPSAQSYLMASVNGARGAIESAALTILTEAEQAIGAAGMIAPHTFERVMRDLRTYLRQPNPDGAAAAFGDAIAKSIWTPGQRARWTNSN